METIRPHHVIQGLRLALGFVLALGLTIWFHYPDASWVMISLVVVISSSHERRAVLCKAVHRVTGTLAGLALGLIALWLSHISLTLFMAYMFVMVLVVGCMMHGKFAYVAIVACITLAVIGSHPDDWSIGLWRALNVFIGATIGTGISVIIPHPTAKD